MSGNVLRFGLVTDTRLRLRDNTARQLEAGFGAGEEGRNLAWCKPFHDTDDFHVGIEEDGIEWKPHAHHVNLRARFEQQAIARLQRRRGQQANHTRQE